MKKEPNLESIKPIIKRTLVLPNESVCNECGSIFHIHNGCCDTPGLELLDIYKDKLEKTQKALKTLVNDYIEKHGTNEFTTNIMNVVEHMNNYETEDWSEEEVATRLSEIYLESLEDDELKDDVDDF